MKAKTKLTAEILTLTPLTNEDRQFKGMGFHKTSMRGTDKNGKVFYPTRKDIYYIVK